MSQRPLLLCTATDAEMVPLQSLLGEGVEELVTGVGLTAATWALTDAVIRMKPRFIVQVGLGGTLTTALEPLEAAIIGSDWPGDEGVEEEGIFRSLSDLGLRHIDEHPFRSDRLINPLPQLEALGFPAVPGVTVQEITTRPKRLDYYRLGGAWVESMEGAALHYAALKGGIPFVQLRIISNEAGERDKRKWHLKAALDALGPATHHLLNKIKEQCA